jgi:hypothetical protein
MAEEVISVVDIASKGVVIDTPPVALAQNIFTDVKNVRFKDGAVRKMPGELLLNDVAGATGQAKYIAVWENPNRQPDGVYYVYVTDKVSAGVVVGQQVFVQDHLGNKVDVTPSTLNSGNGFQATDDGWQHTLFSGGFTFIINNGLDKPHYILDTPGNTSLSNLVLAELPGWDSYNVAQVIVDDTFTANSSTVFDLGQKVDFANNSITVTGTHNKTAQAGSPAGTGTVNDTDFVPGDFPASIPSISSNNFEIYTDPATNTTVLVIGNLSVDDEVKVTIDSRNAVTVQCGIVESFGNLLVAGDLTEKDGNNVIRRLSGVVRTSDLAVPGSVPNNWNPFAAGVSTADEFTLSETNVIQDMKSLQGNMYIYSTDSIHVMRLTGNIKAPVAFSPVTDEYGCLVTGGVKEYDGRHFVVGSNDIYVFGGNSTTIQSLAKGRVKEYFYNNLNPTHEARLFILQNHPEQELWLCYPTLASTSGECDEALIWNYRDNTWTIRELNDVMAGDVGPIKGGGIPKATLTITGNSGNAGYTNVGTREVQTVTINGKSPKATVGTKSKKTITVGSFTSFTTDVQEIIDLSVTGDTGPNTVNSVDTLTFPSGTSFTYDRSQTNYIDGGASAVIKGTTATGIGNVSFPAISVLGTDYADGATITVNQFVEAVKDYINDNKALSDFTATSAANVLTLTSDVPGPRTFNNNSTFDISGGASNTLTHSSTTTGVGVYGISANLSPAISMNITAPAVAGVHAAIDETITLDKNLTSQTAIRDDIISKLSANSVFNGDASSIYSAEANGNNVRLTSTYGGNHSALTINFETSYSGTTYTETKFGGNLTSTVTVDTAGVNNSTPIPTLTVTFPNGDTSSVGLAGTHTNSTVATEINTLVTANSNWSSTAASNVVTATAAVVGPESNNFSIALTSTGTLPSGFSDSIFTYAETRAGVAAQTNTDRITLTPPLGNAITINFDDTSTYPSYDPDDASTTADVTATQIATALETAFTDTTHFTVSRSNNVLTFTGTDRGAITGQFAYTVDEGDTRTGTLVTPLIDDSTASDISVTDGIDQEFAKLTRVTLTVDSATGDPEVIFDRHYGEGPGRLLDPNFTAAADDNTYGDTSHTSDTDYLNAYYDPEKDLNRTNTTEQAKDNGEVTAMTDALLDMLGEIDTLNYLIVTPDSISAPTTMDVEPSQFSVNAKYVTTFSPLTEVIPAEVAPTTATLIASSEGTTVATTDPTQDASSSSISTTFDIVRPWGDDKINPNKVYPIFMQSGYTSGTLFNRIRAGDLTYEFDGTPYVSYVERQQMSIVPNFDTETINSIALWADGSTITTLGGSDNYATLQMRVRATNYPGEKAFLTSAEDNTATNAKANKLVVNSFTVASDYKSDIRITGRLLNYRIDDANADASTYASTNEYQWNISGLQIAINKGGMR